MTVTAATTVLLQLEQGIKSGASNYIFKNITLDFGIFHSSIDLNFALS